jgi:hypothetical protein
MVFVHGVGKVSAEQQNVVARSVDGQVYRLALGVGRAAFGGSRAGVRTDRLPSPYCQRAAGLRLAEC